MAKVKAKGSSLRAFAKRVHVTENAVRKAVASGRLHRSISRDANGRPMIVDVVLAEEEWEQNANRKVITLAEAQRLVTLERERKLKLENDLRDGRLVEVAKANSAAFESSRTIRKAVMNIPSRLSAELAAESDAARIYTKLEAALREALSTAADQLMAATGA